MEKLTNGWQLVKISLLYNVSPMTPTIILSKFCLSKLSVCSIHQFFLIKVLHYSYSVTVCNLYAYVLFVYSVYECVCAMCGFLIY